MTARMLLLLAVLISTGQASSAQLADFCVSRIPAWPEYATELREKESQTSMEKSVEHKGRAYVLEAESGGLVKLVDARLGTVIDKVWARQFDSGAVEALALRSDGWTWINGRLLDHVTWVDRRGDVPKLQPLTEVPRLFRSPCSAIQSALEACISNSSYYSETLGQVFVSGFDAPLFLDSRRLSYRLDGDVLSTMRPAVDASRGVVELPGLNGALFVGQEGGAVFVDGTGGHLLNPGRIQRDQWQSHAAGATTYIGNFGPRSMFLFELLPEGRLREIDVAHRKAGRRQFVALRGASQPIAISPEGLEAEHEGRWTVVAALPGDVSVGDAGFDPAGDFIFTTAARSGNGRKAYFKVEQRNNASCQWPLDAQSPATIR